MFDFRVVNRHWAKIKRSDLTWPRPDKIDSIPVSFSRLQDFKNIEFGCGFR